MGSPISDFTLNRNKVLIRLHEELVSWDMVLIWIQLGFNIKLGVNWIKSDHNRC